MAAVMLVGVVTTLLIQEPEHKVKESAYANRDYLMFVAVFGASVAALIAVFWWMPDTPVVFEGGGQTLFKFGYGTFTLCLALGAAFIVAKVSSHAGLVNQAMVNESYREPVLDFFHRYGRLAVWLLLLILFYRISDIVLGVIANVFYQDMGYSKVQIGTMSKAYGMIVSIFGSFMSGLIALRIGVLRTLQAAAVLVVATNLLFLWLTSVGQNHTEVALWLPLLGDMNFPFELAVVIAFDNFAQGFSTVAFIAWMSSLTNISFTATQYAIFSSIMTLFPKIIGGYSGTIVDAFGYNTFFLFASALGLPVIALIYFLRNRLHSNDA